jgi:hypothetical protein
VVSLQIAALGERVRLAVETLIQGSTLAARTKPEDTYVAATRMIMRLIVILFAEARELLPIGLQGLREPSEQAAWPRLLALFEMLFTRYGGGLFCPGRADADGVARALQQLEDPRNRVSDEVVHRLLDLLTRSPTRGPRRLLGALVRIDRYPL